MDASNCARDRPRTGQRLQSTSPYYSNCEYSTPNAEIIIDDCYKKMVVIDLICQILMPANS